MRTIFLALGWLLIGVAAYFAIAMDRADRQMQAFRVPDAKPNAYSLVPVRWKRSLYTAEGQRLVGKAWRVMLLMYGAAFLGMLLLSQGVDALP